MLKKLNVQYNSLGDGEEGAPCSALTLEGYAVGASSASDDTLSSASNAASAIAKAAAINAGTADHGVTAEVGSSVTTGTAVTAASVTAGTLSVNGVDIGAVTVLANDSDSALRDAINGIAGQTGVIATVDSSGLLTLTADDGRNVITSATFSGITAGTYTGTLSIKGAEEISR